MHGRRSNVNKLHTHTNAHIHTHIDIRTLWFCWPVLRPDYVHHYYALQVSRSLYFLFLILARSNFPFFWAKVFRFQVNSDVKWWATNRWRVPTKNWLNKFDVISRTQFDKPACREEGKQFVGNSLHRHYAVAFSWWISGYLGSLLQRYFKSSFGISTLFASAGISAQHVPWIRLSQLN